MALDPTLRVLVVDDDEDVMLATLGLLRRIGVTAVAEARDGAEAFDRLRAVDVDVVISDWNMDPVSGIELLRGIRADDRLKGLPVVLVTAESTDEKIDEARAAGASGYLVKPFDAERLEAALAAAVGD